MENGSANVFAGGPAIGLLSLVDAVPYFKEFLFSDGSSGLAPVPNGPQSLKDISFGCLPVALPGGLSELGSKRPCFSQELLFSLGVGVVT